MRQRFFNLCLFCVFIYTYIYITCVFSFQYVLVASILTNIRHESRVIRDAACFVFQLSAFVRTKLCCINRLFQPRYIWISEKPVHSIIYNYMFLKRNAL